MIKILIVDDLKSILLTLESILVKEGYFVTSCLNSMDALDRINFEHFDLMITDAIMPGGANGYNLISSIRSGQRNQSIPIIMLTGKREKADIEKAVSVGANDYIIKPIDPDILLTKVKNLIAVPKDKPDFVEAPVRAMAQIQLRSEIQSISETEIKIRTNFALNLGQLYRISSDFFKEIDLQTVNTRISHCTPISDSNQNDYMITAQFVGLTDKELTQIRLWVRKKLSLV